MKQPNTQWLIWKTSRAFNLLIVLFLLVGSISVGEIRPLDKANELTSPALALGGKAFERSRPDTTNVLNALFTQEAYFKPFDPKLRGFFRFPLQFPGKQSSLVPLVQTQLMCLCARMEIGNCRRDFPH